MWSGDWRLDATALLLVLGLDFVTHQPPPALRPVVWMGRMIAWMEMRSPGGGRRAAASVVGLAIALLVPLAFGGAAWLVAAALREAGPIVYVAGVAVLLKTTFAVKELGRAATRTQDAMETGDTLGARRSLRSLASRDARTLTPPLVAMAAIESVAGNTTDSFVGPWLAFAVFGLPGAFAYRAINTLDSMIGYRGRYEYLGKASARLDEVAAALGASLDVDALLDVALSG